MRGGNRSGEITDSPRICAFARTNVEVDLSRRKSLGMSLDRECQLQLHEALEAGDPTATARAFEMLLDPLIHLLRKKWPDRKYAEAVWDTAIDSIASYVEDPSVFDPEGKSLLSFLLMDAHGDLINAYQRKATAAKRMRLVESRETSRNGLLDEYPSDREPPDLTLGEVRSAFPDPRDRRAILLLLQGEKSTAVYAEAWELEGSAQEQAKAVKRNKDRIKARIKRLRK